MKKVVLKLLIGTIIVLSLKVFISCMADENFSVSPLDKLTFSTDTVKFDTVISGQGTHTVAFEIYNQNKNGLRITKVWKDLNEKSPFRVAVDGVYIADDMPTDFSIPAGDSLKVFLEMTPPVSGKVQPQEIIDHLNFQLESNTVQNVVLQAYGQDVEVKKNGWIITEDTLLSSRIPYQIYDSIVVQKGATVTLSAGTRLYFHNNAKFIVYGTLKAAGEIRNPILMRGDRLGNIFTDQSYDQLPGQWHGIEFKGESYGNYLNCCDIHGTSVGIICDSSDVNVEKIKIENSILHNSNNNCLQLINCKSFIGNTQVSNGKNNCVYIAGGNHEFVHCTIGSFYAFDIRSGVALYFANYIDNTDMPLYNASFRNCIITGLSDDELLGEQSQNNDVEFNYFFQNCLLNTPKFENENVENCLWDTEDNSVCREQNFQFNVEQLDYSFQLDSLSIAVGNANKDITIQYYPEDRLGVNRVNGTLPDIGCYQSIYFKE